MAKSLTNKERQKKLDYEKYVRSSQNHTDFTGKMEYCVKCEKQSNGKCTVEQADREAKSLCAVAYNKLHRSKK